MVSALPNLNSSASLPNLVKFPLLKPYAFKANEAEVGVSPVLSKLPNLLRVALLLAKFGSFTVAKLAKLVKVPELIVKFQAVGRD